MKADVDPEDATGAKDPDAPPRFEPGGFVFVVSGPSGAGKGTLVERLMAARPECVFSISCTTRPRRPTEADGVEYEFVTREEFERRRGQGVFLEWAEVHGHLYGTPLGPVDEGVRAGRVVVLDVDVQGGSSVRSVRPEAVSAFIYPPSIDALRQRLLDRKSTRLNSSHITISYAVFCLKKKKKKT